MQHKAQKTIKCWHFGSRTATRDHSCGKKWPFDGFTTLGTAHLKITGISLSFFWINLRFFFSKQFWILWANEFDQPYDFTVTCNKDWVGKIRNPAGAGNKIAGKLMLDQLYLFLLVFKRVVAVSSKTAFQAVQWVQFQVQGIKLQNYCSKATKYRNMLKNKFKLKKNIQISETEWHRHRLSKDEWF